MDERFKNSMAVRSYTDGYSTGYDDGLFDAWDTARQIVTSVGIPDKTLIEIFGTNSHNIILSKYTGMEAIKKIKAWEESKDIHVGDVVTTGVTEFVVTFAEPDGADGMYYNLLGADGKMTVWCENRKDEDQINHITRTGRTMDVQDFLRQIKNNGNRG